MLCHHNLLIQFLGIFIKLLLLAKDDIIAIECCMRSLISLILPAHLIHVVSSYRVALTQRRPLFTFEVNQGLDPVLVIIDENMEVHEV
jgi:hypothetical protein